MEVPVAVTCSVQLTRAFKIAVSFLSHSSHLFLRTVPGLGKWRPQPKHKLAIVALRASAAACVFRWLSKFLFSLNALLHWSHGNGRSPVWVRRCRSNFPLAGKALPQNSHENIPECIRKWRVRSQRVMKRWSHLSQQWGRTELCLARCAFRRFRRVNCLPQMVQLKSREAVCDAVL